MKADGMHIVHINDPKDLEPYREAWTKLIDGVTESSTIFLTPEWVINWWNCYGKGKTLSVLLLFDGERLAGVAPLAFSKNDSWGFFHILRFIGTGVADHLDFCIAPEVRREGMAALVDYIMTSLKWDLMDLVDIPEDSENVALLRELLEKYGVVSTLQPAILCPYLRINGQGWEAFYAARRSKSTRQDLRRRQRRLSEIGNLEFRHYDDPVSVEAVFPQLFALYEKRWENRNLSLSFAGEQERLFYPQLCADLSRRGQLHLLTLELDGRVIAFTLSAVKGSQFTWLITAHDPELDSYFPGELILVRLLEEVFQSGSCEEFDFTRGDEPYKFKWTDEHRPNLRVLVSNHGLMSKIPFLGLGFYSAVRRNAKKSKVLRKIKLDLIGQIKAIWQ
jgi:CelD/BcsL family acetyltransferase involved in cellulose biosynthesis